MTPGLSTNESPITQSVMNAAMLFIVLTIRFICLVQRAQYHTSRGSFTSLSVTCGLWQSWWYRLWHSWHSTNWFPIVTVICLGWQLETQQQVSMRTWKSMLGWYPSKFNEDVPADHTSQAHFHGKVISIGLVIVVYVWQKVFARLNGNWRSTILLFLQTRLFWRVHLSQVYPDLREGREGGTSGEYMLILVPLYITCKSISILIRIILSWIISSDLMSPCQRNQLCNIILQVWKKRIHKWHFPFSHPNYHLTLFYGCGSTGWHWIIGIFCMQENAKNSNSSVISFTEQDTDLFPQKL